MTMLNPGELRKAFGSFLTGVTVVTTVDSNGQPCGFTANSFASVSLAPPLLLICPGKFLSSFAVFEKCTYFAVSILAEGQEDISNIFASFKGDRFAKAKWKSDSLGLPLIDGAAAHFSCKTAQVIPAGDHVILIGEVMAFTQSGAIGLGYAAGEYFSLSLEREAASAPQPGRQAIAGAIIEYAGEVLLEETTMGLRPPQLDLAGRSRVRETLLEYLKDLGFNAELGKAYSIFDDRHTDTHYSYFLAQASNDFTSDRGHFFPINKLAEARFVSEAHATMMQRFALEYETQSFALYVGDESGGDIHSFTDRS